MNATNRINGNRAMAPFNKELSAAKNRLDYLTGLLKASGRIKLFSAVKLAELHQSGEVSRDEIYKIEDKTNWNAFYKAFQLSFSSKVFERVFASFEAYTLICMAGARSRKLMELPEELLTPILTAKTVTEFRLAYSNAVGKRVKPAPPVVYHVADVVRPELLDTLGSLEPGQLAEIRQRAEALLKKLDFLALIDGKKGKGKGKGKGKPAVQ